MRATRALIHLQNLRENISRIREHTKHGPLVCLAVKADAYGHGIVEIGREAAKIGVEYLAVASVDEAVELRDAGLTTPILLYSLPIPDEIPLIVEREVIPVVSDAELAGLLESEAGAKGQVITVHLKIDTGMGRIGCEPAQAPSLASEIRGLKHLELGGVSTHFACSDSSDPSSTRDQISRFESAVDAIRSLGIDPGIVHAGNSGGTLAFPGAWYDMIRPGILAYGYYPSDEQAREIDVTPVMDLRSRVVFIKEVEAGTPISYGSTWRAPHRTHIGTIPVGYGDGFSRLLSNSGRVAIGGESYPIVGRVCMDHIMVDLGPECRVRRFDDVALFGADPGGPDAEELSRICQTIPYEITCAVSKRVPRIYVD